MPILANAKKALRSSRRKAETNQSLRSRLKTALDTHRSKVSADSLSAAFSAIDISVKKNIIHGNKAARLKQQMSKLVKA